MKKIEIINGVYGARNSKTNRVTSIPIGGTVNVTDEEAERLVRLKVAKIIGEEALAGGVATPPAPPSGDGAGVNTPDGNGGAEGQENGCEDGDVLEIVDGHYTVKSLLKLERKDMEAFAADLGIDANAVKKCRNKTEVAELIAEIEVADEEDEEDPPALGVENPVV